MKPRHFIASFLCAVFIVYPLSAGPAIMLNARYNKGLSPSWAPVFAPLFWICDHCPPLEVALQWYLEKWLEPVARANGLSN
jgi:hypothetical protein